MQVVSSQSIILKHQDYKERDRLVTFLARDKGRMTGIARGARNPKGRGVGAYEPFTRGVIYYVEKPGSDLVAIRKCDPQPPFFFLAADYDKFLFAGYMAELINFCPIQPGEAEPYFLLLATALERVLAEKKRPGLHLLRLDFELDFLELLGVQPDWSRCASCGRALLGQGEGQPPRVLLRGPAQFDPALNGLRCPDCRGGGAELPDLAPGTLAFLAAWRRPARPPGLRPTRNALAQLEQAITRHLIHQIEREPRSLALLPAPEV